MGIGMFWLPASPRWLLLRSLQGSGNVESLQEAAIKSLRRLRGPVVVDTAAEQVNEILADLSFVVEDKETTIGEVFQGKCLKALIIAGGLVVLQQVSAANSSYIPYEKEQFNNYILLCKWQITGQPSVLYYAASILQTAGFSAAADATRISILLGVFKVYIYIFFHLV